jgi:diguanylate cyclase (GGDEF)-like protein
VSRRSSPALALVSLLDVFGFESSEEVRQRVVDAAAESFEAEVVGIVCGDTVVQSVGLGRGADQAATLVVAARSSEQTMSLPGLGQLHLASLPIEGSDLTRLVLGRSSGPFEPDELRVGRAMIRVMRLAVRTISALQEQRQAALQLVNEVARNRELADELHRRHGDLMTRMIDIQGKLASSTGSVLAAVVEQGAALFDGDMIGLQLLRPDGNIELRHSANTPTAVTELLQVVEPGQGLAGRAISSNRLVVSDRSEVVRQMTAGMSAPIHQQHETVGAITVASTRQDRTFDRADQETLLLLAGYASVAVSDARLLDERQQALEQAEWQATHDPLTSLANRRLVLDTIDHHLGRDETVVVLYIDVDRFKSVNDLHGHQVGDELICELARRLTRATRSGDLVGRLAGDEFIVVCGGRSMNSPQVRALADRLSHDLGQPVVANGRSIALTVSIGLATSDGLRNADELIHAADVAMYQAKSGGRNLTGLFDESLQRQIRRRAALAERIEVAAATGEGLHLEYQPIVDIESGEVRSHEALLRLVDPVLGRVPPDEFIPQAEELGIISSIDEWVLANALRESVEAGTTTSLSVNVSPGWLVNPGIADRVAAVARRCGFPLDRLSLEVTERVALAANATAAISSLRKLGVRILLDDFGTGYSSLAYIRTLEIDGIKIDRGFLEGVDTDRHRAAILEAVLTLTDRLDAVAVAEGVESAKEARLLRSYGCRLAQGFYFGRPAPAPDGLRATARAQLAQSDPVGGTAR